MNSETSNTTFPRLTMADPSLVREQISRWMDGDVAQHEIDLAIAALSREEGRYC